MSGLGLQRELVGNSPGGPLSADSVEKVAPPLGLRQNHLIGQQESTEHDGPIIEWAGATVLLVQS